MSAPTLMVQGTPSAAGISRGPALDKPLVRLDDGRHDGARSADGQMLATYLHGLFESAASLGALLARAGLARAQPLDPAALREAAVERLADACAAHLDPDRIGQLLRPGAPGHGLMREPLRGLARCGTTHRAPQLTCGRAAPIADTPPRSRS